MSVPERTADPGDPVVGLARLGLPAPTTDAVGLWLTHPRYAEERGDVTALIQRALDAEPGARAELEDAFCGPLPIGTGGRRGPCGPGPNRINAVVLRETAQGLADAMHAEHAPTKAVVVYDTRRDSRTFAHRVARQLVANGITVLLVDAPRATPMLSFLVRARGCGGGVMISASHNPPGDNGIKVYGPSGGQVLGARDADLMRAIEAAMDPKRPLPDPGPSSDPALRIVGDEHGLAELDREYHDYVLAQGVTSGDLGHGNLQIVFTPLHGVGHTAVVPVLRTRGLVVHTVDAQCDPDGGRFSTVKSANPEVPASMALAEKLARERGADLVLATDPDADRLGALCRAAGGEYAFVDGNRLGVLMLDHVLSHGPLPADGWVLTTLVTSPLIATLCRATGVDVVDDLLVGFKYHAGMMEEQPTRPLVFGCEESHGYTRGTGVYDKDGAVAALLLAERAALSRAAGTTLLDDLDAIWRRHGYHREHTASLYASGAAGRRAIAAVCEAWRERAPTQLGPLTVVSVEDRQQPRSTGSPTRDLPGNVLAFELAGRDGMACRLVVRPSGTEPKLKLYALGRSGGALAGDALAGAKAAVDGLVASVLDDARARAIAIMDAAGGR